MKAGVAEETKKAILRAEEMANINTSVFAIKLYDAPLYRRFNTELEGVKDGKDIALNLKFKEFYRGEYLMDENNENFQDKSVDYLGIWSENKATGLSFHVDTAWVKRGLGYIKPQYLVSIDRVPAEDEVIRIPCPLCQALGEDAPETCIHDKYITKDGFERGKYLVNFVDSVAAGNEDYKWGKYSRVGFVDGLHIGDSLYLLLDQFAGVATKDINIAAIMKADSAYQANVGKDRNNNGRYIKNLKGDEHKAYTWSFRFVDLENSAVEEEPNRAFLFESLPFVGTMGGNTYTLADQKIQPQYASWLKMQNGCLVMSDPSESTFNEIKTGGDDALIFNIEEGEADDMATDNEVIATSEVTVIAGEGQVTIAGAAGKKVVITNILGQVVANTVVASDNAAVAVPAGVVVVAVEGEDAVKAIVK